MTLNFSIEADELAQTIDCLRAIAHESTLHIDSGGLEAALVDPANVAMSRVDLPESAFEDLQVEGEHTLGINLDRLDEVLGLADSDELVHAELDAETRKLALETGGLSFTLALIDPDSIRQEPDLPELEWPAEISCRGADLARGCRAADLVSDHVRLEGRPDDRAFVVSAEGDTDDVELTFGDEELVDASVEEPCASLFSLEYMKDLVGPLESDGVVTLRLGEEFPVHLRSRVGPATVEYAVAPRIKSE